MRFTFIQFLFATSLVPLASALQTIYLATISFSGSYVSSGVFPFPNRWLQDTCCIIGADTPFLLFHSCPQVPSYIPQVTNQTLTQTTKQIPLHRLLLRQQPLHRRHHTRQPTHRLPQLRPTPHDPRSRKHHLHRLPVFARIDRVPAHRSRGQWRAGADVQAGVEPAKWAVRTVCFLPVYPWERGGPCRGCEFVGVLLLDWCWERGGGRKIDCLTNPSDGRERPRANGCDEKASRVFLLRYTLDNYHVHERNGTLIKGNIQNMEILSQYRIHNPNNQ